MRTNKPMTSGGGGRALRKRGKILRQRGGGRIRRASRRALREDPPWLFEESLLGGSGEVRAGLSVKKRTRFIFDSNDFVSVKCDESSILSKEHSLAASVDGQLVANAQKCHAGEFGNGRGKLSLLRSLPLPHPHLQIRQSCPDVPLGALGNLTGDGDRDAPSFREKCRENLVFRGLEPD